MLLPLKDQGGTFHRQAVHWSLNLYLSVLDRSDILSKSFYKPITSGIKVFHLLKGNMYIPASLTREEADMLSLEFPLRQKPPPRIESLPYTCKMVSDVVCLQRPLALCLPSVKETGIPQLLRAPAFCFINPFPVHFNSCHFSLCSVLLLCPFPFILP